MVYFSFSFIRTKISRENEASCYYPIMRSVKVRYQSLYRSTASAIILPLLFLFNYNMVLLGVIFPTYFCPKYKQKNKVSWYTVALTSWVFGRLLLIQTSSRVRDAMIRPQPRQNVRWRWSWHRWRCSLWG